MRSDDVPRANYAPDPGHVTEPIPDPAGLGGAMAELIDSLTSVTLATIAGRARLRDDDLAEGVIRLELLDTIDGRFEGQDPAFRRAVERHIVAVLRALEARGG